MNAIASSSSTSSWKPSPINSSSHSSYAPLEPLLKRYPLQSAPLFHTYTDLCHASRWSDVVAIDLKGKGKASDSDADQQDNSSSTSSGQSGKGSGYAALKGRRPDGKKLEVVVPCHLTDDISVSYMDTVFAALTELSTETSSDEYPLETSHVLISILNNDSTVVYYKLAPGLVKPVN